MNFKKAISVLIMEGKVPYFKVLKKLIIIISFGVVIVTPFVSNEFKELVSLA